MGAHSRAPREWMTHGNGRRLTPGRRAACGLRGGNGRQPRPACIKHRGHGLRTRSLPCDCPVLNATAL
jgi:hypothetical protein